MTLSCRTIRRAFRRVVLVWDKRLPIPSNLQGLYRCEFEGNELSWYAGMKLMKAIRGFKQ